MKTSTLDADSKFIVDKMFERRFKFIVNEAVIKNLMTIYLREFLFSKVVGYTPWTQNRNWPYVRRSEDVKDASCTFNLHPVSRGQVGVDVGFFQHFSKQAILWEDTPGQEYYFTTYNRTLHDVFIPIEISLRRTYFPCTKIREQIRTILKK